MAQTLTQSEFIQVVSQTTPDTLNIWYTFDLPLRILGLTIPIIDLNGTDQENQLLQCIEVVLTVEDQTFRLLVENPQLLTGGNGTRFMFFEAVEQIQITAPISDLPYVDTPVIFLPGVFSIPFTNSDSDVLMNNVGISRKSYYIQESDRYKYNNAEPLAPLNIDQLRTNTAIKASVQDSNYEISGWKEARYEGVFSNRYNYSGLEGVIDGAVVEARTFPTDISLNLLRQQLSSSIFEFTPFFLGGDVTLNPRDVGKFTGYELVSSASKTEYTVEIDTSYTGIVRTPAAGDVVAFTLGEIRPNTFQDRCTILDTQELTGTSLKIFTTPLTGSYPANTSLRIANTSQFYKIVKNTLQAVDNQYVLIEQGDELYRVDGSGFVISRTVL